MKTLAIVLMLIFPSIISPASICATPKKPADHSALSVVSRMPLPERQMLYRKFMDAIQRAADDGNVKYPLPNSSGDHYQKVSPAEYNRRLDVQTQYVNKLTEKYTGAIRRSYGLTSHEEDMIEYEATQKGWHD